MSFAPARDELEAKKARTSPGPDPLASTSANTGLPGGNVGGGDTQNSSELNRCVHQFLGDAFENPLSASSLSAGGTFRPTGAIEFAKVPIDIHLRPILCPSGAENAPFRPLMNVRADESLFVDNPQKGGTLGYRLTQGVRVPADSTCSSVSLPAATACHDLQKVSLCFWLFFFLFQLFSACFVAVVLFYLFYIYILLTSFVNSHFG